MNITAALAWFDEPPEFLARCVRSLEGLVDEVVAVDGGWRWFPGARCASSPAEVRAIREAADDAGIKARVIVPSSVFDSQVHKRAFLMEEAGRWSDWVFVIDADEYIVRHDEAIVRSELADTDAVVAAVAIENLHLGDKLPHDYHREGGLRRRFYRSGTTVVVVHSGYSYQGRHLLRGEPAVDLGDSVQIVHDICNRGPERNEKWRQYREARTRERVEVWV